MKNITKIVNQYIENQNPQIEAFDTIYNDIFPEADGRFVISRHDPSTAREKSYIDGTFEGVLSIAYYARSASASEARELLDIITKTIEDKTIESEGVTIELEVSTLPSFVGTDEKNNSIYTANIKARYMR